MNQDLPRSPEITRAHLRSPAITIVAATDKAALRRLIGLYFTGEAAAFG